MRVYSGDEALALKGDELQAAAADLAQSVALYDGWLRQARARLDNQPLDARIERMDPPAVGATYRHKTGWTTIVHAVDGTTITVSTPPGSDSGPTQPMAVWYFWRVFELQAPPGWSWIDEAWVGHGLVRVVRRDAWWDGRTLRAWPTALEAMTAIDAERRADTHRQG